MVKRTLFRKKKYCRTKPKQFFRRCDYLRKITDKARQSLRVVGRYRSQPPSGCVCYYQAVYDLCSFSVCVISIYLLLYVCGLDAIQLSNLQWMAELGLPRVWPCHHEKAYQHAPSNTPPHWIKVWQLKKILVIKSFSAGFTPKVTDLPIFFVLPQSRSPKWPWS